MNTLYCPRAPNRSRQRGFTLVELMVTIAIAAILLSLAAPSFLAFQRKAELTSLTNTLLAALNTARGEAMKRNSFAMLTPLEGTDWSSGWRIFVDRDLNKTFDAAKDLVVAEQAAPSSSLTISAVGPAGQSAAFILYNGSGYALSDRATLTIRRNDVDRASESHYTRRIVVAPSGRTRSCRPADDTSCTENATQ
ncbi:prepilin-type N-terminal cleavage/methylation domain-containing protein [Comamonadaceae bacterium OH2545_COT-014]|nr:prepilin-type N-terminal cleavage/methylation domain-containing protein [Comamonadaceae bacterium OH2545_COT-014]